jgi:hypothetical protein
MTTPHDNPTHHRVAEYLDGQAVSLDRDGQALADEIRHDEKTVGRALDVALPARARSRAIRRMQAAASSLARNVLRAFGVGSAVAAAAAALLLAARVWNEATITPQPRVTLPTELLVEALPAEPSDPASSALAADTAGSLDDQIDALEKSLQDFWQADLAEPVIDPTLLYPGGSES